MHQELHSQAKLGRYLGSSYLCAGSCSPQAGKHRKATIHARECRGLGFQFSRNGFPGRVVESIAHGHDG